MEEIWRQIDEFPQCSVSNMGRVRRDSDGLIYKTRNNGKGYICVNFRRCGKANARYIHRLVAIAFCDGYAKGLNVNHKNFDRSDNRAANLEWVTPSQNNMHTIKAGKRPRTNIRRIQISEIRARLASGESHKAIADNLGVSTYAIKCIATNQTFKNVGRSVA